jgi:hypothetical protein
VETRRNINEGRVGRSSSIASSLSSSQYAAPGSADDSLGLRTFRITFWLLIVLTSVFSGGFFLHDNTMEFWNATVQTTLDGSVPLSEVFFPSVLVCNINQGRTDSFLIQSYFK